MIGRSRSSPQDALRAKPFVRKIHDAMRQRVTFSMSLILGAGNEAVIVTVQTAVDAWFVEAGGRVLDPRFEDAAEAAADAVRFSSGRSAMKVGRSAAVS